MGLKPKDLNEQEPSSGILGTWHANLLLINRRKYVLFVNDKTLFNFLIAGVKKEQLGKLEDHFRNYLQCILAGESFSEVIREH